MPPKEINIIGLIVRYLSGELDQRQELELREWLEQKPENRIFFEKIRTEQAFLQRWQQREKIDPEKAIRIFDRRTKTSARKRQTRWWPYVAAATILLAVGISFFQLSRTKETVEVAETEIIRPGGEKAVLILADGKKMNLQEQDSLFVHLGEGSQAINKNNLLVYQGKVTDRLQYHELQVPRGGEYQVKLTDGTVVRLNSGSSLKYPVAFGAESREVELSGEAYFEVAKSDVPFYVRVGKLTVRVYGTCFNINSHFENHIQTALLSGKVGIMVGGKEFMMQPSQLADFNIHTQQMDIQDADLTPYLAWTKGLFIFNNEPLEKIMATLSLWYDMDVFFQNPALKELHFTGYVKRYDSIDSILRALAQSVGVKFSQQGKTLTISY